MNLDKNYKGIDADLETSLEEYGFVARPITVDYPDEYFVIYKMGENEYGSGHIRVSELDALVNGTEWASDDDINSMLETVGSSKEEWMSLPFESKFNDLISYWGTENVMGTDYYPNDKKWAFEEIGIDESEEDDTFEINSISELYDWEESSQYPYARDMVAYFIFGDRDDNLIDKAIRGVYSKERADESKLSEIMLGYEYNWKENMEQLDVDTVEELGKIYEPFLFENHFLTKNSARTYDGINALRSYQKSEIEDIQEYIADNGTIIEFVAMNDRDSSSGMTFAVTINGRGIYASSSREKAMEFYKDEIAKYKNNYKYAKGGSVKDNLEKELRKLQRELNSSRLGTYIEGDDSEEAMALRRERESKLTRFNEVLKTFNEIDKDSFAKGGSVSTSELNDLMEKINESSGSEFSISGAYGNYELWAKDSNGGDNRIEVGSRKDIKEALIQNRYNKKYTKYAKGGETTTRTISYEDGGLAGLVDEEQMRDISFKIKVKTMPKEESIILHEVVEIEEYDAVGEKNVNLPKFHLIYGNNSLAIFDAFGVDEVAGLKREDAVEFIENLKKQGKTEKDGSFMAGLTNFSGDQIFMFFNVERLNFKGFANRVLPHEALHLSRYLISLYKNKWMRENLNTPNWWEDKRATFTELNDDNEEFFAETLERTTAIAMDGWFRATGSRCLADGGNIGLFEDGGETRRKFIIVDEDTNKVFDKEFYDWEDAWRFLREKVDDTDELSSYSVIDTEDAEKYYADGGSLEKKYRFPEYGIVSYKDLIDRGIFKSKFKSKTNAVKYDRNKFNRMDGNEQKKYYEKLNKPKFEYNLTFEDGSYYSVPKEVYDYANINETDEKNYYTNYFAKGGGVEDKDDLEKLWIGYASAILFSENDSDTEEPLDSNYSISDFDKETVKSSKDLIRKFYIENKEAIKESGLDLDTIGNDIWYTRAGHGAGFFDHSLDQDIEDKLTNGAKALGEYPTVETYDGKISVRGGRVFFNLSTFAKGGSVKSKAEKLFEERISYRWKNTDMGSGWLIKLDSPNDNETLEEELYLDIYDFDEDEYSFEDWKEDMLQTSKESFIDKFKNKYFDDFLEYIQRDKDDYYADGGGVEGTELKYFYVKGRNEDAPNSLKDTYSEFYSEEDLLDYLEKWRKNQKVSLNSITKVSMNGETKNVTNLYLNDFNIFDYADGGGVDGFKRFDVDFYDDISTNINTSVELIIRADSLNNAIEDAIKKAYELKKNYIEFYHRGFFLGSINFANSNDFKEGKFYNKFISDDLYADGGGVDGDYYAKGGGVGYNVFNYTDNIYATDEVFKTKTLANKFIKEFRNWLDDFGV